jgi:hypothetical protein
MLTSTQLTVTRHNISDGLYGALFVCELVIGSSSHATHRMVGSVAVSLARHAPVPLLIVP